MASRTFTSCIDCFYRYRGSPADISAYCSQGHSAERVDVCWNYDQEFYETTYVRDPPNGWTQQWRGNVVRLCDPSKGTCRRNNCIFAHGVKEQRKWNMILQQHRKSSRPTGECFKMLLFVMTLYMYIICCFYRWCTFQKRLNQGCSKF